MLEEVIFILTEFFLRGNKENGMVDDLDLLILEVSL